MNKTEFLIGRSGLDLLDDFYPDDLPNEWRFDYYSTLFKALALKIDTEEDLEQIFTELEDSDEVFELVISIDQTQLLDATQLASKLKPIHQYQSQFILFCELDEQLNAEIMAVLNGYQLCFQSDKKFKFDLNTKLIANKHLYFNQLPILYTSNVWDEKQIRDFLQDISLINTKTVLICKHAESETLNKIRIIAEILGF
ncbi:conserved hypothetical protein [Abyssogena phaseoliformis symbiont OG214]|uniref:hypothetical protein n=1 Tax=Abyssogena phaseoliformis symbiont TaxID=596095 RepID=UPI0019151BF5|nr:hypothetical protein [Abyssogena phaseoliformis symbiont]MBW5289701.1 hypothetical protein [Candidatus Ruthia sp. Apha_13_S6]BBB22992.1 conserved hypothetical protein [Abyssogena phaseoliformis symbiont OG214]